MADRPDLSVLRDLAVDTARAAGDTLRRFADRHAAGDDLGFGTKSTITDPVSEADRAAERLIAERLTAARPDDGLLGEEGQAERRGTSGLRWVVDPLDGTVNFLYGLPAWCVSVACEDDAGSLVGVVHDPNRDETFVAVRGGGATCNGRPTEVGSAGTLERTLVATGYAYAVTTRRDWAADVADLLGHVRDVRRGGAAALDLAWTAAGRFDAYLEFGLSPWDWAAGRLLVTESGGTVTTPERVLGGERRTGVLAGGATACDALGAWLAERPPHRPAEDTP
ncbi:inositol monophosphatase family protein [Egicoccus halophilus]|uniref:Inositol-1-monophosphatase n=1 Tax=Egicoccus halophilus TaxID=1670830 RepID=A0A8J3ADS5_9ACTN|nr:inositol monophosphatase family protein [Egicoccus halophilus]GGI04989.1 inositol monophosphatase [Egicoccus halophilus]